MKAFLLTIFCSVFYFPFAVLAETTNQSETISRVEPFSFINMINMVMGLAVVLALILGLAWALRKYGRLSMSNQVDMKILGGLSLGTRERAVLVQVEGQKILLGVAPGRVNILQNMSAEITADNDFDEKLSRAIEGQL
ncbi:MAG: flagellar biosynthetic protein FliO [Gammaproteobacteria bacterium]|nr:flagellar biosynthetic protein FliO [Gammaproteobacteria bacterium]MCW8910125.1 flagellar biosynthetic protein FliO [Gammaproteobacteria bacterium]MCW9006145.1 flagellar biosynthetic protein FliO [Gammaproteobacteria bacterium]MCW9056026.1 flagellar biosynthetic protein FliO [Gammaproteobacteria bacterium]